jgi:hypothetical protein
MLLHSLRHETLGMLKTRPNGRHPDLGNVLQFFHRQTDCNVPSLYVVGLDNVAVDILPRLSEPGITTVSKECVE